MALLTLVSEDKDSDMVRASLETEYKDIRYMYLHRHREK